MIRTSTIKEGAEITFNSADAFKFRVVMLRQLKDARTFFRNGSFTKVWDVVQYFNAGIPQDPVAGAAPRCRNRFTRPLGLRDHQVDDLTDFLENAARARPGRQSDSAHRSQCGRWHSSGWMTWKHSGKRRWKELL